LPGAYVHFGLHLASRVLKKVICMLHTSFIELNRAALDGNIQFLKKLLPEDTRFSMVVKANAYGHGIEEMIPLVEKCGVDHFSVFSVAEAMRVKNCMKQENELMILGFVDDDYLEWAIKNEVSFYVFTKERLLATIEQAQKMGQPARIHVELETGMYRTGFCEDELKEVIRLLKKHQQSLIIEGLCTHYAGAEDFEIHHRIETQIKTFRRLCKEIEAAGIRPRYHHTACSAAVFNYPETIMDLVRVGIACYGFWPNQETRHAYLRQHDLKEDPLKRVLSWKSKILSVDKVPKGRYVSYGKAYFTTRPSKIATVPVGYGYGFSRDLSNNGHVLVGGMRAPVVGYVNMNMLVIDVTEAEKVAVNDEVVLIGQQGDKTMTVSSFSDMNNSMNYELLTRLPDHIPKVEAGSV